MDLLKNLSILVAERNEEEVDFVLLDEDSQFGAWVTSPTLIQGTGVYVRSATFGYLNEENEFEADWCGTILYDQADDAEEQVGDGIGQGFRQGLRSGDKGTSQYIRNVFKGFRDGRPGSSIQAASYSIFHGEIITCMFDQKGLQLRIPDEAKDDR